MADFHFSVTQIKRSAGQSAIAAAAYRAGEKLYSDLYGEYSDYTRTRGIVETGITSVLRSEGIRKPRKTLERSGAGGAASQGAACLQL